MWGWARAGMCKVKRRTLNAVEQLQANTYSEHQVWLLLYRATTALVVLPHV